MSYQIIRYREDLKNQWDDFIANSGNGTFLHRRDYMDYHADRFKDFSLMIFKNNSLISTLPAHREGTQLIAHNGLTYSDFIFDKKVRIAPQIDLINASFDFLLNQGFTDFFVKTIPSFFHNQPNASSLYLYHRMLGHLSEIKPFFVLHTDNYQLNKGRKKNLKRIQKQNLSISDDLKYLDDYWQIVNKNLRLTHRTRPVHTLEEIQLLAQRFPEQIKLLTIFNQTGMLGGALLFIINKVIHFQYINADPNADKSAIDLLIIHIIERYKKDFGLISFGSSSAGEQGLNSGLTYWKESFGCKVLNQYFYKIKLQNRHLLNSIMQ